MKFGPHADTQGDVTLCFQLWTGHFSLHSYKRSHAVKGYYQYQCFMSGVELLQNLIHDGVGQIGNHRQLHLPEEENEEKREQQISVSAEVLGLGQVFNQLSILLQGSVDILSCSLHEGTADGGARDGNLFRDGGERWAESLGSRAGHWAQLTAKRNHRIHHHLCTTSPKHESANTHYVLVTW